MSSLSQLFRTYGEEGFKQNVSEYAKELGLNTNANYFDILAGLATQKRDVYEQAIAGALSPSQQRSFQTKYNTFVTGDSSIVVPGADGKTMKISFDDLQKQVQAAQVGESLFTISNGASGPGFVRNNTTNYVWGRDANGKYVLVPNYSAPTQTISQGNPVDANGNPIQVRDSQGKVMSYAQLLQKAGFSAKYSNDGSFQISGNELADLGIPGLTPDQQVTAYIDQDGRLQFVGPNNQAYNLNFDANGKYTGATASQASAITPLPGASEYSRFSNPYLATQDLSKLPSGAIGLVDQAQANKYVLGNAIDIKGTGPLRQLHLSEATPQNANVGGLQGGTVIKTPALKKSTARQKLLSAPSNAKVRVVKSAPAPHLNVRKPVKQITLKKKVVQSKKPGQASTGIQLQGGNYGGSIRLQG